MVQTLVKRSGYGLLAMMYMLVLTLATRPVSAASQTVWDQGFESDTSGWLDNDDIAGYGDIERVASGTDAIASAAGLWHARVNEALPFSRFDGYRDTWPGQFTAELDVYLDTAWVDGEGFDYSVAASGSDGNHQRDYIFHVGVVQDEQGLVGKHLLVNGSNNTDFTVNAYKLANENSGNYYEVTTSGWYTLQHVFREEAGALAVDLKLLDDSGTVVWTATRTNAGDTIPAEVGGNRYAWMTAMDVIGGLHIDNHQLLLNDVADTEKPFIEFVMPTSTGELVGDTYTVETHATDNDLLKRMAVNVYDETNSTFLQPCGSTPGASSLGVQEYTFNCNIDTVALGDGTYTLRASARDESDNVKAVSVQIVVDNTAPEKVTGMTVMVNNNDLGCYPYITSRDITVDWDDSADPNISYYEYQADADTVAPYDFTTTVNSSERSGTIRDQDGTYNYRVRAVDARGNVGEWSEWCGVTLDRVNPVSSITAPEDEDELRGTVEVRGSVADENLWRYYTVVRDEDGNTVAGPGTVYADTAFNDQPLFNFDTSLVDDGIYTIRLEARDKANNKGPESTDVITVEVDNVPERFRDCFWGGWRDYGYRNQGQCIRAVLRNKQEQREAKKSNRDHYSHHRHIFKWFRR